MSVRTKAVVFDCFGVLVTDGWRPFRTNHFLHSPELLERATTSNKLVDAGLKDYDEFLQEMAELANLTFDETRRQIESNVPNVPLLEYIRDEIKPHYKVGLLSNAGANWLSTLLEPWQLELFDEVVLSYQLGAIKPDKIMYQTIAAKLGVEPEESIFIDDQQIYCHGAECVGMRTVVYTNPEQTIQAIKEQFHA